MSPSSSPSRLFFLVCLLVAIGGGAVGVVGLLAGPADAGETLVARSVCEAHELRARQAEEPGLQIEIPAEFDHAVADAGGLPLARGGRGRVDARPGPADPVQPQAPRRPLPDRLPVLSLRHGPLAGRRCAVGRAVHGLPPAVPAHLRRARGHPHAEGALEAADAHRVGPDPPAARVRAVPAPGATSARASPARSATGRSRRWTRSTSSPDTNWWPWLLPTQKLEMGWCIQCHRENGASRIASPATTRTREPWPSSIDVIS